MPVQKLKRRRKGKLITCYRFGTYGKIYCGPQGRKKALRQGRAIKRSQTLRHG